MSSFFSEEEIKLLGFNSYGKNVLISKKSSIYGASNISLGNNIRIDDFCILSGKIVIGDNVHIAAYSAVFGGSAGVEICDYANVSSRVCIYALSDDFSGCSMTNPTIPEKYKKVLNSKVTIGRHVIIGSGSTILPGVSLGEGTSIGAMSLCKNSTNEWTIYAGVPAKKISDRKKDLLILEAEFEKEHKYDTKRYV